MTQSVCVSVFVFLVLIAPASAFAQSDNLATAFLSDLVFDTSINGWGPSERDRSNGETGSSDGRTLSLNGTSFGKGVGAHAPSTIAIPVPAGCNRFAAVVGVDDEVGANGGVSFEVWAGTRLVESTPVLTGSDGGFAVDVALPTPTLLKLVVTDAGDGIHYDHADWGAARLLCDEAGLRGLSFVNGGGSRDYGPRLLDRPAGSVTIPLGADIQSIVNAHPQGTTYWIERGTHRLQSIVPKTGDRFYGEYGAILSGAQVLTDWSFDGTNYSIGGQRQQGTPLYQPTEGGYNICYPGYPRCGYPEDLFMDSVPLLHVGSVAALGPGKWFFDYDTDRIYVRDNPAGRTVETSVTQLAIGGSATGVVIRNLVIEKYASALQNGAVKGGAGWTVTDNEIRLNHGVGLSMAANRTVTNNYIHRNFQMGIGGSASGSVVDHNEIAYNNNNPAAQVVPYWEGGGTKFVRTDGLTISNNFSHHNGGSGLACDVDCINVVYEYNLIEDNLNNGIMHETSYAAIIRHNTIRRNGTSKHFQYWTEQAGIQIHASRDVEIYGNLLEDNWNGLTALHANRGTGRHGVWELRNLYAHDNTIKSINITEAGWGRSGLEDAAGDAAFTSMNNRFQNNTYHVGPAANYFMWMHHDRDESYWRSWPEPSATVIR